MADARRLIQVRRPGLFTARSRGLPFEVDVKGSLAQELAFAVPMFPIFNGVLPKDKGPQKLPMSLTSGTLNGIQSPNGEMEGFDFQLGSQPYFQMGSSDILGTEPDSSLFFWMSDVQAGRRETNGNCVYSERASATPIFKFTTQRINGTTGIDNFGLVHRDDAGNLTVTESNGSIEGGGLHLVGFTKKGTTVKYYLDGLLDKTFTLNGNDTLAGEAPTFGRDTQDLSLTELRAGLHHSAGWRRTLNADECWQMFAEPTRWNLYRLLSRPSFYYTPAPAGDALVLNNVQTGTIAFGAANTSRNVTITSVDTSKCFIIIDWQTDSAGSVATTQHYRARLSSSTNIAIDRTAAVSGDDGLVRWWAVEFSAGITVRHFTGTSRNTNVAIGATVDLAKTFAIISDRPQTFDYDDSQIEGVDIVSTTNFQVKTDNTAESAPNWAVQIIEFDAAADPVVEAVTITMSGGTTTNTGSISAITVADSMLIGSGTWSETLGVASQMGFSAALDDTTTVSVTRVTGTGTLIAYMFVVDWGSSIDIRTGTGTLTSGEGTSETQTFSALGSTGDAIAFMRGGSGTFGAQSNHSGSPDDADYAEVSLDSTTQITVTRGGSSEDLGPYNWQVIDFAGFAVAGVATRRYSLSLTGVG